MDGDTGTDTGTGSDGAPGGGAGGHPRDPAAARHSAAPPGPPGPAGDHGLAAPLAAAIRDQVARHRPRILSCIGGNAHAAIGLIRHPRPFDFRLDPGDMPDPAAEPLPLALVRAALERGAAHDLAMLRAVAALAAGIGAGPLFHLESPPPLASGRLIAERADAFFRDAGIAALGVAPAALRMRLWRLHGRIWRDACTAAGVRFVPVPASVLDADGYLRADLAADATHGNAGYGERVLRAVEAAG